MIKYVHCHNIQLYKHPRFKLLIGLETNFQNLRETKNVTILKVYIKGYISSAVTNSPLVYSLDAHEKKMLAIMDGHPFY